MKKTRVSRVMMLAAGLIAVCVILLSPSFSPSKFRQTAKTEKSDEKQATFLQAPVDAIPGSAVKIDEPVASVLTILTEETEQETTPLIRSEEVTRYLKVLFRTVIASNAP